MILGRLIVIAVVFIVVMWLVGELLRQRRR